MVGKRGLHKSVSRCFWRVAGLLFSLRSRLGLQTSMKIIFKVNPLYLLNHTLERAHGNHPFSGWKRIARMASSSSEYALMKSAKSLLSLEGVNDLKKALVTTHETVRAIQKTSEFMRLVSETERYKGWLESEWKKNGVQALKELKDISGLAFPDIEVTVLVTHPKLHNGTNVPDKNIICWGNAEEWRNYSVVYICHELLHVLTHKKVKDYELMHAFIELATDNELRIRLNQAGEYFHEEKYDVGHPELRSLERKLLPMWKKFLKKKLPQRDIVELERYFRS